MIVQPIVSVQRAAAVLGNAGLVLAGQQAGCQRTPGGGTVTVFLVDAFVFRVEAMPLEHIVNGLFHDRLVQVMSFGDLDGRHNLSRRPFGRAPVERLAPFDDVVHGPNGLFDGRVWVGAVAEDQVYIIQYPGV